MTTTLRTTSTRKVRRDIAGGKRGDGHSLQFRSLRTRPDPRRIRIAPTDPTLTSVAGLVPFGAFLRNIGLDHALRRFDHLKSSLAVVYPIHAQLRLLLDAVIAGEPRIFGIEHLAADPLFVRLAGGCVPSIDTLYDDLRRFDEGELAQLEALVAEHGLAELRASRKHKRGEQVTLDLDSTVETVYGEQMEGAHVGYNPRCHGRPSYHPLIVRIAETQTIVGARLRPGDTSFGAADVPTVIAWIRRVREAVGPHCQILVRMDIAGDCTDLLEALDREPRVVFVVKARMTKDLLGTIFHHPQWASSEPLRGHAPTLQAAEINFHREEWKERTCVFRVIAVRSREKDTSKQIVLWEAAQDWTVQAYITNHYVADIHDVEGMYNGRAGIEPLISELKNDVEIGAIPTQSFSANYAMLLVKLLAYNLFRRYVSRTSPAISTWKLSWWRRVHITQAGRLLRSGRRWTLRVSPSGALARMTN